MPSTRYKPLNSSCALNILSTQRRTRVTCSWFDESVSSSTIMLKKSAVWRSFEIFSKTSAASTFRISFCMSLLVYLFVLFCNHWSIELSSAERSLNSCTKLLLDSSPSPLSGNPWRARNLIFSNTFRSIFLLWSISFTYEDDRDSPMSLVVSVNVTTLSIDSLWHSVDAWLLNASRASFQLQYPLLMKVGSYLEFDSFFSLLACWHTMQNTASFVSS